LVGVLVGGKCYHVVSFGDDGEGASSDLLADGVYSHLFVKHGVKLLICDVRGERRCVDLLGCGGTRPQPMDTRGNVIDEW
jgi:hypothetical protein